MNIGAWIQQHWMTDDLEMETDTYFLSALILSEEHKRFIQIWLEQQGHGSKDMKITTVSNYLQVIEIWYWI